MKIGYCLYDETYSGVIESQALDVVRYFNDHTSHQATLIAALPFRSRTEVFNRFRTSLNSSIFSMVALPQKVQPFLLRVEAWRLGHLVRQADLDLLICRNALSCFLALTARDLLSPKRKITICYDGRGALQAEACEFNIYPERLKALLIRAEKVSVLRADHRIAVTEELVNWWRDEYGYSNDRHSIVPTTISTRAEGFNPMETRGTWRQKFGFHSSDLVLAFAGGRATWQGIDFWLPHMREWLEHMPNLKLLLLTPKNETISQFTASYPSRVLNCVVRHEDVLRALSAADFGILWREINVTNRVASPTKLSEYLHAGLSILANDGNAVSRIIQSEKIGLILEPAFRPEYPGLLAQWHTAPNRNRLLKSQFYSKLVEDIQSGSNDIASEYAE